MPRSIRTRRIDPRPVADCRHRRPPVSRANGKPPRAALAGQGVRAPTAAPLTRSARALASRIGEPIAPRKRLDRGEAGRSLPPPRSRARRPEGPGIRTPSESSLQSRSTCQRSADRNPKRKQPFTRTRRSACSSRAKPVEPPLPAAAAAPRSTTRLIAASLRSLKRVTPSGSNSRARGNRDRCLRPPHPATGSMH
jgi:hypothetical protein